MVTVELGIEKVVIVELKGMRWNEKTKMTREGRRSRRR